MNKELQKKIWQTKALRGKTVEDIVLGERFFKVLSSYWKEQTATREAASLLAASKHLTLNVHPMDEIKGWDTDTFRFEYLRCLSKASSLRPQVRRYIEQLCGQAYAYTIALYICDEFPELKDQLLNTKHQ